MLYMKKVFRYQQFLLTYRSYFHDYFFPFIIQSNFEVCKMMPEYFGILGASHFVAGQ